MKPGGEPLNYEADDSLSWMEEKPQHLLFSIYTGEFGVELETVREVFKYTKPLAIPDMPPYIAGIINNRGDVIPVFDLRVLFGLSVINYDESTAIIVVEQDENICGLIVDGILDVTNLTDSTSTVPFETERALNHQFVSYAAEQGMPMINLEEIFQFIQDQEPTWGTVL